MDHPVHAADVVDKGEGVPKVVAAIVGLVLVAIAVGVSVWYLGAPPPTNVVTTTQKAPSQ